MIDKQVVSGNFRGIKPGMLVCLTEDWKAVCKGDIAMVLETILIPRAFDEGFEFYDPMLIILHKNKRIEWPVENATIVLEDTRAH